MIREIRKKIVLIDGPRGVGKDAVIEKIMKANPDKFRYIQSYSTRKIRPGEKDGDTHYFITEEEFMKKYEAGDIFEFEMFGGTYRGMSRGIVDDIIANGFVGIKTIGYLGIRSLRKYYKEKIFSVFITADKDLIRKRLEERNSPDIEGRLAEYDERHEHMNESDHIIFNNGTLDECVTEILELLGIDPYAGITLKETQHGRNA